MVNVKNVRIIRGHKEILCSVDQTYVMTDNKYYWMVHARIVIHSREHQMMENLAYQTNVLVYKN